MLEATVFDNKTKGNSSIKKPDKYRGKFYRNKRKIDSKYIPKDFYKLWNTFNLIKF